MEFSKEFLSNKVFNDQILAFDSIRQEIIDGTPTKTGAIVQPNGDILFRIYAPKAKNVTLMSKQGEVILTKQDNGLLEGVLPFNDNFTGPQTVNVFVDGTIFLYPYLPVYWSGNRPCNFIEVPEIESEFTFIKDVPHGTISREIYWTDVLNTWERSIVYTPPGYMKSTKEYPVLYLLHGFSENEICWQYTGRLSYILDNLIAEGKAEPFIVVINNGMLRYSDNTSDVIDDAFERMLIESCIPYIEKNYCVKTDKWNRAIVGLSMGAYMTNDIGLNYPDLFGYIGQFTASMTHETMHMSYARPYLTALQDLEKFSENYKVFFRSTTPAEDHFEYFTADDDIYENAGIDKLPSYIRIVYSKRTSKWNSWRQGFRDYASLIFK